MKQKRLPSFESYTALLKDIKSLLQRGLLKAYKAVDNIKVQTYWHAEKSEISGILEILISKRLEKES